MAVPVGPDNTCCFCLTLRTGVFIIAAINALFNVFGFYWYTTSASIQSGWSYEAPLTNLDVSFFAVFALQILVDGLLIYGAVKRIPAHTVPWLCANAVIMGILLVLVSLFLFFGSIRMSLGHNEYVSVLSTIGFVGAAHLFSCLVVFQFRKNLMEEMRLMNNIGTVEVGGDPMPQPFVRAPSPPPSYDEVSKVAIPDEVKIALESESPPEYSAAMAMGPEDCGGQDGRQEQKSPASSFYVDASPQASPVKLEGGDKSSSDC